MRVRELAKEVQHSTSEVLEVLAALGEHVSGPNGFVEVPVIRRVHEHFHIEYVHSPEGRPPSAATPASPGGLPPAPVRRRRDNHALIEATDRRRDHVLKGLPLDAQSTRAESAFGRGLDASPAWEFEGWKLFRFSEVERDIWLAVGLRAGQARIAAELRDNGVTPQDLDVVVAGWSVRHRLLNGEGAAGVARLLARQRESETG